MKLTILNKTNAYPDSRFYFSIMGISSPGGKLCYVTSDGELVECSPQDNQVTPPNSSSGDKYSN